MSAESRGKGDYRWDADIVAAMAGHDLAPVLERHGSWAVTLYGVECIDRPYWIEWDRLHEPDWIDHMKGKPWVDFFDFLEAFDAAKKRLAKPKTRTRFRVLKRDNYACRICGARASDGTRLEIDHRTPKARGGKDSIDNLWTLCWECNNGKSDEEL